MKELLFELGRIFISSLLRHYYWNTTELSRLSRKGLGYSHRSDGYRTHHMNKLRSGFHVCACCVGCCVYDFSNFIGRRKELQGVQSDERTHPQITNSKDILSSYEEVLRTYGLVFLSLPF